jgi:hypothetical protein
LCPLQGCAYVVIGDDPVAWKTDRPVRVRSACCSAFHPARCTARHTIGSTLSRRGSSAPGQ